jgi:hypothetical protein
VVLAPSGFGQSSKNILLALLTLEEEDAIFRNVGNPSSILNTAMRT